MIVYSCFPKGKRKALTMSYDDGVLSDERLVGIFNKYGIKGTFNLNFGRYDHPGAGRPRIPKEKVKALYAGHEVATHGYSHPTFTRCPIIEVANEIMKDRKGLEKLTGGLVRGHAYPNGAYNEEIKHLLKQLGIAYARTVESTADFSLPEDPLQWNPTCHHNDGRLMEMAEVLVNFSSPGYLKIMYVWGHSYEFDNLDNWNVIEAFCKYVGGRENIWYATNIEIIDYLEAIHNLRFSADNESVYNPNANSVWLSVDDRVVEIKGGAYRTLSEM